jgi:hypothetical protein
MSGRRPRLVQEGLPIIDGSEDPAADHLPSLNSFTSTPQSLGALKEEHAKSIQNKGCGNAYKLKTSLVVGEGASKKDDPDDIMMDDDDDHHRRHHFQVTSVKHDDSKSLYYRSHGSVYHGEALEYQNYNPGNRMAIDVHQQHPEMQQHLPAQFYNNNFQTNSLAHLAPTPNSAPPPIYHMPSPLLSPLVVLDGANIAYNYSESLNPNISQYRSNLRRQPDPHGLRLVIEYFLKNHCRVQAVVPTSWYQLKPRPCDTYHLKNRTRGDSDAKMITEEVEELRDLRQRGFLVAIPPGDDDDAYALALARREDNRLLEQQQRSSIDCMQQDSHEGMDEDDNLPPSLPLGGYVVSNDMFHDAIRRDENRQYQQQQHMNSLPLSARPVSLKSWLMKKRISYSFANVGSLPSDVSEDDKNAIRLDFLPNPRNELIEAIDASCGHFRV